jgi:hypothetical protein
MDVLGQPGGEMDSLRRDTEGRALHTLSGQAGNGRATTQIGEDGTMTRLHYTHGVMYAIIERGDMQIMRPLYWRTS